MTEFRVSTSLRRRTELGGTSASKGQDAVNIATAACVFAAGSATTTEAQQASAPLSPVTRAVETIHDVITANGPLDAERAKRFEMIRSLFRAVGSPDGRAPGV